MTKQQLAVTAAQNVAGFMRQLRDLHDAVNAFLVTNADMTYDTFWATLPTAVTNANGTVGAYDVTAGSGTVSVTNGGTAVTFSASQSALTGAYLVVTGDASGGLYLITGGATTSWVIGSPYGGVTAATAAWGTVTPNNAHPIAVPLGSPLLIARNDLVTSLTCLANFQSYMNGVAITTQGNTPRKFADLLNS